MAAASPRAMRMRRQRMPRRNRSVLSSPRTRPLRARRRLRGLYLYTTALLLVSLQRQLDEAGDELRVGEPGLLPQLGVHAHGGEAGDRVHFVQDEVSLRRQEEVHAGQPGAVDGFVGSEGQGTGLIGRLRRDVGGDVQARAGVVVLGVVVVELALERDLAYRRRFGLVVAQDRHLHLPAL